MEYKPTTLPQYWPIKSRSEFSSATVQSGHVLLFSQDGQSITAKLPDGSYVTAAGSGASTDFSSTTAQADKVLSGYLFYDSGGSITQGTMPTVVISVTSSSVIVPSGYIASSQSFPVPDFSQVTATSDTVRNGALFYDSTGQLAEGSMPFTLEDTILPTTSAQIVSSGLYLMGSITVLGDAALVGSNIVSGASIFGVTGTYVGSTGTDVGSTTAQASDVLSGKIFYTSGGVMSSGTILSASLYSSGNTVSVASGYISAAQTIQVGSALQSATFVPTTSDQVISSGAYLAGQQVIKGDSNLVASNIVSGVSIFGVSGTAVITYQPAQYTINRASDQSINGTYTQQSTFNNRPVYELNQ